MSHAQMKVKLIIIALLLMSAPVYSASVTFDQGFDSGVNDFSSLTPDGWLMQTFTVGKSGELAYIDLNLFATGLPSSANLFVDLWTYSIVDEPGCPLTCLVFEDFISSETVDTSRITGDSLATSSMVRVDYLTGLTLNADEQYVIYLFSLSSSTTFSWARASGFDAYADGAAYGGNDFPDGFNNRFPSLGTSDFSFETFMVAVPIPAAVWLFGSCIGLLGWFCRRQSV